MKMFLATLTLSSSIAAPFAQAAPRKAPPRIYRVDGRPVPVSCLASLAGIEDDTRKVPIDLRSCGNPTIKPETQSDGSVGYVIPNGGYFYYRYVGQSGGLDILLLESSGGGSGEFAELVGVKHSGHFLRWMRDYAGGDRCNGGVSGARVSNGKLTFDQAITPWDLIRLAQPNERDATNDLEGSATSCIGVSHMIDGKMRWTGVTLTEKNWPDRKGWTETFRYQGCFNELYRETILSGHTDLDRVDVMTFARAFATRCVRRS